MREVHSCESCGFVSTIGGEFGRVEGINVCLDCRGDYGKDADVTRSVNEKVAAAAKAAVATKTAKLTGLSVRSDAELGTGD